MYQYPYGNAQQLNLDWILGKLQELEAGSGGGADLEEIANALVSASFDAGVSYRRYDYCFYNGKLYRALNDTSGAFNPADWLEVVIGDDIPVLTRLLNAVDASVTSLQTTVGNQGNAITNLQTALGNLDSDDVDNASNVTGTSVSDALDTLFSTINGKFPIEIADLNLDDIGALIGGVKPTAANRPLDAGNLYGTVWHYASTANYATQIYQETGTNDAIWMRKKYNGTWYSWTKIITATSTTITASLVDPLPTGVTAADVRYIKCGQMVTVYAYVQRDANAITTYVAVATNLPIPAGNPYLNNAAYAPLVQAFVLGTHTGRPLLSYVQTNGEFRISRGETAGGYYFSYSYITSDI